MAYLQPSTHRPVANMAAFFAKAGPLVHSEQIVRGEWPTRTFIVRFEYADGSMAEHDGKTWNFQVAL